MRRVIELKHVGPKEHVRTLIGELIDRLEGKLRHFPEDALSIHVLFEENGTHALYHTSLTCHVPGHLVVARKESKDAGAAIREAFGELGRQLEKRSALLRRERWWKRRRSGRKRSDEPEGTL